MGASHPDGLLAGSMATVPRSADFGASAEPCYARSTAKRAGGVLEIHHKPKLWADWREFAKEIGAVVIGVLLALAGQQIVETVSWRHKTADAEAAIRRELAVDLSYAAEQQALGVCANRYIDVLQRAVATSRPDIIAALYRLGPPTHPHPWRIDTWTAALSAQTPDHMAPGRVQAYSLAARFVNSEETQQWELVDLYSEAMAGRFGRLTEPSVANDELKTADRLRANEARRADITQSFLDSSRQSLRLLPSADRAAEFRKVVQDCETKLQSVPVA